MKLPSIGITSKLLTITAVIALSAGGVIYINRYSTRPSSVPIKLADSISTPNSTTSTAPNSIVSPSISTTATQASNTNSTASTPVFTTNPQASAAGNNSSVAPSTPPVSVPTPVIPPAVTAISANFAWGPASAPASNGDTTQNGYCTYAYSDGSTQIVADGTLTSYVTASHGIGTAQIGGPGCNLSLAPPAN